MERDGTSPVSSITPTAQLPEQEELEKLDELDEEYRKVIPPSFNGRLNLSSFAFQPPITVKGESASSTNITRRSPRTTLLMNRSVEPQGKKRKLNTTPSPAKRARPPFGYAPPSTYEHLPNLPDRILPNLIVLFVGVNPGIRTSISGHAYAHPSNRFWKLLHSSGITPRKCHYSEDVDLPHLFALGNTNIVERPTRNGSELSKKEMDEGVAALQEKIRTYRPEAVCIVGKSIWESIWRVRHKRSMRKEEFNYGWQDESENMGVVEDVASTSWKGARVFAATSTSGLAASPLPAERERIWRELGGWVEKRRSERKSQNESSHLQSS